MDRVDAVEQIFAKLPPRYHSEQVAVRGADEADVHRYGRVAAHAEDTPALDGRQQLRLQVGRQVADLVEEKRAVVGDLEFPGAVGPGVGEGSLTWPNSSLSKSVSGTAPISTETISSPLRAERLCISRASISLPVPFSP